MVTGEDLVTTGEEQGQALHGALSQHSACVRYPGDQLILRHLSFLSLLRLPQQQLESAATEQGNRVPSSMEAAC